MLSNAVPKSGFNSPAIVAGLGARSRIQRETAKNSEPFCCYSGCRTDGGPGFPPRTRRRSLIICPETARTAKGAGWALRGIAAWACPPGPRISQPCNVPRELGQISAQPPPRNRRNGRQIFRLEKPTIRGERPMWKAPASRLCGCLAALPLIGCAGDVATPQATAVTPAAIAEPADYYTPAARVYAVVPAVPAAVLVLWPGDARRADKVSAPWVRQTPRTLIRGV